MPYIRHVHERGVWMAASFRILNGQNRPAVAESQRDPRHRNAWPPFDGIALNNHLHMSYRSISDEQADERTNRSGVVRATVVESRRRIKIYQPRHKSRMKSRPPLRHHPPAHLPVRSSSAIPLAIVSCLSRFPASVLVLDPVSFCSRRIRDENLAARTHRVSLCNGSLCLCL